MMSEKNRDKNNILFWFVGFFTLVRMGLFLRIPYYAIGGSGYDDEYLINIAESLFARQWLGVYGMTTLIKGISFPIFVALAKALCMPYGMLLGLFYILSAYVFVKACRHLTRNQYILSFIFLYAIYSPVSFSTIVTQRVYRNAIVYPAIILVVGCILNLYFSRNERLKTKLLWLISTGLSFSFFYYIREDSIWLLPLLVASLVIICIWYLFFNEEGKKNIKKCILMVIPIAIFIIVTFAYKGMNYKEYGVFTISDRSSGAFGELTGNIIKVSDETNEDKNVWISKKTLEKVVSVCPSLADNKELIMSSYAGWANESGDVWGDWSVWALRIAFEQMGYYDDATHIDSFCKQVNSELLQAVNDGKLKFDDAIHFTSQSRGIYLNELPDIFVRTCRNIWDVVTYKDAACGANASGTTEQIRNFEAVTGDIAAYPTKVEYTCSGWIIDKQGRNLWLQMVSENGETVGDRIDLIDSPDVANAFPDVETSEHCRFLFTSADAVDTPPISINIYTGEQLLETVPIESLETDNVHLNIDVNQTVTTVDGYVAKNNYLYNIANTIIKCYSVGSYIIFPISIVCFLLFIIVYIRNRNWNNFEPCIILFGIISSAVILELGVTIFTEWLGGVWFYSPGLPAMIFVFESLVAIYVVKLFKGLKVR